MDSRHCSRRSFVAAILALGLAGRGWGHSLHVGATSVTLAGGAVALVHVLFEQDLSQLLLNLYQREPDWREPDDQALLQRYVEARFAVLDRDGQPLPLRWIGIEREADIIRIRQQLPAELWRARAAAIRHAVLADFLADQVNVVTIDAGSQQQTVRLTGAHDTQALH